MERTETKRTSGSGAEMVSYWVKVFTVRNVQQLDTKKANYGHQKRFQHPCSRHMMYTAIMTLMSLVGVTVASNCSSNSQTLRNVNKCPRTENGWRKRAITLNCSQIQQTCTEPSEYTYHCLVNAYYQKYVEVCAERRQSLGFCPEYNIRGRRVQNNYDEDCKKHPSPCPQIFMSDEVYKYPSCFEVDETQTQTETGRDTEDGTTIVIISIIIPFIVVLSVVIMIMIIIMRIRGRQFLPICSVRYSRETVTENMPFQADTVTENLSERKSNIV